jgi:hypothetical protein
MLAIHASSQLNRRRFFKTFAAAASGQTLIRTGLAERHPVKERTVRDRLWVFACPANSDFPIMQRRSVMTPVESAFYLGVPNIIVVQAHESEAKYGRFEPPFAQYAVALRPLKRVVWSVVGSGGFNSEGETKEVLELARQTPNFRGIMLDDFFTGEKEGKRAQWTVQQLAEVRKQAKQPGKNLDLLVTLYTSQLELQLRDYLDLVDVCTLWTGRPADLPNLEDYMAKAEKLAPRLRKMLGCYVVDYGAKKSTPVELMKHQCETGLKWLRQGRIEGIIFLGNTTMDLGLEAVEWTREWIRKVGDTSL